MAAYKMRAATLDDLKAINELSEIDWFDVGLHNLELYMRTSPNEWFVVENERKEIVAFDSYNRLEDGIFWGYQIVVRPDHRGKGIGRMLTSVSALGKKQPFLSNATPDSIARFKLAGFRRKLTGRWLCISNPDIFLRGEKSAKFKIQNLTSEYLPKILEYDFQITKLNRADFLRQWIFPEQRKETTVPLVHALVAVGPENELLGYGILRLFSSYWAISPLYANSDSIADCLLRHLAAKTTIGNYLYIHTTADKRTTLAFTHEFGFLPIAHEIQTFGNGGGAIFDKIDWEKVYTVHEFWPA